MRVGDSLLTTAALQLLSAQPSKADALRPTRSTSTGLGLKPEMSVQVAWTDWLVLAAGGRVRSESSVYKCAGGERDRIPLHVCLVSSVCPSSGVTSVISRSTSTIFFFSCIAYY